MKKIVLSILILTTVCLGLSAQDLKRHEINLGVGILSSNQFIDALTQVIVSSIPYNVKLENSTSYGAIHVAYRYSIIRRLSLGGIFVYDYNNADAVQMDIKRGKFNNHYITLAAEVDFKYIDREKFKLYSLVGVGATLLHQVYHDNFISNTEKNSNVFFNFQITPIGIKFGNTFGGLAELGFGYKGIITAGFVYRP